MKKYFFVFFLLSLKIFASDVDEWPFFDVLPPEVILNIYEFMDEDAGKLAITRSDLWAMFTSLEERRIETLLIAMKKKDIHHEKFFKNRIYNLVKDSDYSRVIYILWRKIIECQYEIFRRDKKSYDVLTYVLSSMVFNNAKVMGGVRKAYRDIKKRKKSKYFTRDIKPSWKCDISVGSICYDHEYLLNFIDGIWLGDKKTDIECEYNFFGTKIINVDQNFRLFMHYRFVHPYSSIKEEDKDIIKAKKKSQKGQYNKTNKSKKAYLWYLLYANFLSEVLSEQWNSDFSSFMEFNKKMIDEHVTLNRRRFLWDLIKEMERFRTELPFIEPLFDHIKPHPKPL